ncbi:MAG TPA: Trp family transcriptional regulator [Lentisphaeria bacterium]|nr:transcriptional regulator [Lentisphaerota bacterium]HPY89794.1 Trp family transcriptional regulator [Lentisphaeria bacterium]HQC51800.1 Trp family transcriptional regulator [Lentisphaeria bacterium]HQL88062.1 Trp family transcriptional regulator [Lentisphaeria bacterium]
MMSQDQKIKPWVQELAGIIGQARDQHELEVLLEGLLTPSELEGLHLRWHLLRQLRKGCTQREISRNLGVSLGKIARGSRLLKYGSEDFSQLFERLNPDLQ